MGSSATAITNAVSDLLPGDIGFGYADLDTVQGEYEVSPSGPTTATRQREFAAGRRALNRAMSAIGLPKRQIPSASDHGPLWPEDIVGAITHSGEHALAVVASRQAYGGLGIDLVAPSDWPEAELIPLFLQPDEIACGLPSEAVRWLAAKEAAIKLLRDATGRTLGFLDLSVTFAADGREFSVAGRSGSASNFAADVFPLLGMLCSYIGLS